MFYEMKKIFDASSGNFMQDMIGAACLIVMLVGALHLPTIV